VSAAGSIDIPGAAVQSAPRAHGPRACTGLIRSRLEDFAVEEILGFAPDGEGAHTLVHVRKIGANTDWAARRLARAAGVAARDVGFCGLKDRRAVATQWFSLPGAPDLDREALSGDGLEILERLPHGRKLRRGAHAGNRFRLRIRECSGHAEDIEARLRTIACRGVPNYFGEQRFGRDGSNLGLARAMASGRRLDRRQRGFALSAARSAIFNAVLARRVVRGDWDRLIPGDLAILDGTASWFPVDQVDAEAVERLERLDLHPSGPLWGDGQPPVSGDPLTLELEIAAELPDLVACLSGVRLKQARRALRLSVSELQWQIEDGELALGFRLPRGAFATTVLAELVGAPESPAAQAPGLSSR
jgi:tRNA pseudouridine13 synthase